MTSNKVSKRQERMLSLLSDSKMTFMDLFRSVCSVSPRSVSLKSFGDDVAKLKELRLMIYREKPLSSSDPDDILTDLLNHRLKKRKNLSPSFMRLSSRGIEMLASLRKSRSLSSRQRLTRKYSLRFLLRGYRPEKGDGTKGSRSVIRSRERI